MIKYAYTRGPGAQAEDVTIEAEGNQGSPPVRVVNKICKSVTEKSHGFSNSFKPLEAHENIWKPCCGALVERRNGDCRTDLCVCVQARRQEGRWVWLPFPYDVYNRKEACEAVRGTLSF